MGILVNVLRLNVSSITSISWFNSFFLVSVDPLLARYTWWLTLKFCQQSFCLLLSSQRFLMFLIVSDSYFPFHLRNLFYLLVTYFIYLSSSSLFTSFILFLLLKRFEKAPLFLMFVIATANSSVTVESSMKILSACLPFLSRFWSFLNPFHSTIITIFSFEESNSFVNWSLWFLKRSLFVIPRLCSVSRVFRLLTR